MSTQEYDLQTKIDTKVIHSCVTHNGSDRVLVFPHCKIAIEVHSSLIQYHSPTILNKPDPSNLPSDLYKGKVIQLVNTPTLWASNDKLIRQCIEFLYNSITVYNEWIKSITVKEIIILSAICDMMGLQHVQTTLDNIIHVVFWNKGNGIRNHARSFVDSLDLIKLSHKRGIVIPGDSKATFMGSSVHTGTSENVYAIQDQIPSTDCQLKFALDMFHHAWNSVNDVSVHTKEALIKSTHYWLFEHSTNCYSCKNPKPTQ